MLNLMGVVVRENLKKLQKYVFVLSDLLIYFNK